MTVAPTGPYPPTYREHTMQPIWNHRELIGYARTAAHAHKILRGILSVNPGWKITVRCRDTELIELPAGFVYSVHP